MEYFNGKSAWIAPEDGVQSYNPAGRAMLFRRRFMGCGALSVAVCADSEYRLFCNGREVGQGPAMADGEETFYDTYDLTQFLHEGENEVLAEVVAFATAFPDFYRGGCPMARMACRDAFILDGVLVKPDGSREDIGTGDGWEAAEAPDISFFRCANVPAAGPGEASSPETRSLALFSPAQVIEPGYRPDNVKNSMLHFFLVPKRIPDLVRSVAHFREAFDLQGISGEQMHAMLDGGTLAVPANSQIGFVLDAIHEITGRLLLHVLQGSGTIEFFYAENLFDGEERHFSPHRRHDAIGGPMKDVVTLHGNGCLWKSFFYRAFRFVRVAIKTTEAPIVFRLNEMEKENYPYQWQGDFSSDVPTFNRMWEMGRRTLELCSHHIFEDCPYYERLQYAADSRIASWIAFLMCGDSRLTEQAIRHFRHSIRDEGLTAGSFPSRSAVILPPWSLHFLMMVYECYLFTGKEALLTENLSAMRRILEWFLAHRLPEGGIGRLPHWNMADFSKQWIWSGEPPDVDGKSSAYITFFVMECLEAYALMAGHIGSENERLWAQGTYAGLLEECGIFFDNAKGIYADTPDKDSFSLLTNAQAVLAHAAKEGALLCRAMEYAEIKWPSPFGNSFVFKAFMECGEREYAERTLHRWEELLVEGRTVFPEGTPVPRSECHVWSAFPAIGMLMLYSGLHFEKAGGEVISLAPWQNGNVSLNGKIYIHHGVMEFCIDHGKFQATLPEGVTLLPSPVLKKNGDRIWNGTLE